MKKIIVLLLISFQAICQPVIKLTETSHDFGTIEEGIQASYSFNILNTGTEPLTISNVRPSCGCTTPDWTKTPIPPGGKGFITATFNSQGRPGAFNKQITIETNAPDPSSQLTIKGFVGPKVEKTFSKEEINNSPVASIERNSFNFGKVQSGQVISQKVKITNTGKSKLRINGIQAGCNCVEHKLVKNEIEVGESTEIELLYRPSGVGEQLDIVTLSTNDISAKKPEISLKANPAAGFYSGGISTPAQTPFK